MRSSERESPVISPPLQFFAAVFGATWACWIAAGAIRSRGATTSPALAALAEGLFLLGTFSPGLLAAALTHRSEGRIGTRRLLEPIFRWQVPAKWYVFAVGYFAAVKLTVAAVHRVAAGEWPEFGEEAWYVMAGAVTISTWVQAGEEVGWRGYALPRLTDRFGLARASLVLGVVWAVWHLPLFFIPGTSVYGQSFPLYLLQVTAISVTMAWLYWRTGGSLLLVMLFHAAINNTKDIVPSAVPGATNALALSTSLVAWLTVALLWIVAAILLRRMKGVATLPVVPLARAEQRAENPV
jgi:CAAX protease family protein